MASEATVAAPAPTPWRARRADGGRSTDGQQEGEAGHGVGHETSHQHRPSADPVGQAADGVLGQHAGGEERGHDHSGQGIGAAQVPDVLGQHRHDGRGPHPLQEHGEREGADQPARALPVHLHADPGLRPGFGSACRGGPSIPDVAMVRCYRPVRSVTGSDCRGASPGRTHIGRGRGRPPVPVGAGGRSGWPRPRRRIASSAGRRHASAPGRRLPTSGRSVAGSSCGPDGPWPRSCSGRPSTRCTRQAASP